MSPRGRVHRKKTGAAQQAKAAPTSIVRWGIGHRIVPGAVGMLASLPSGAVWLLGVRSGRALRCRRLGRNCSRNGRHECDIRHGWSLMCDMRHTPHMAHVTADLVLSIPHLAALPPAEAERFARDLVVRRYAAREFIAIEGEPCRGFF